MPPEFKLFIPTTPAVRGDKVAAADNHKNPLKVKAEEKVEVLALDESEIGETEIGETEIGETEIGETEIGETEIGETEIGETEIGEVHIGEVANVLTKPDNGEKSLDISHGDIAGTS